MLLRGRPLDIAYNSGMGEGLESYRRIFEEFHSRVASRYVGTLTTLLSSKFGDDVEGDLAAFEKSVRRYEQESGKTLDEEMLLGIVVNGLKDTTLQSHIIRNSSRLKSFQMSRPSFWKSPGPTVSCRTCRNPWTLAQHRGKRMTRAVRARAKARKRVRVAQKGLRARTKMATGKRVKVQDPITLTPTRIRSVGTATRKAT